MSFDCEVCEWRGEKWGEFADFVIVLKHREFSLGTGQVIPVLIKAEVLEGAAPYEKPKPWMKIIPCAETPAPTV